MGLVLLDLQTKLNILTTLKWVYLVGFAN